MLDVNKIIADWLANVLELFGEPAQLKVHADAFRTHSTTLTEIYDTLNAQAAQIPWSGGASEVYVDAWQRHVATVQGATDAMRAASSQLDTHTRDSKAIFEEVLGIILEIAELLAAGAALSWIAAWISDLLWLRALPLMMRVLQLIADFKDLLAAFTESMERLGSAAGLVARGIQTLLINYAPDELRAYAGFYLAESVPELMSGQAVNWKDNAWETAAFVGFDIGINVLENTVVKGIRGIVKGASGSSDGALGGAVVDDTVTGGAVGGLPAAPPPPAIRPVGWDPVIELPPGTLDPVGPSFGDSMRAQIDDIFAKADPAPVTDITPQVAPAGPDLQAAVTGAGRIDPVPVSTGESGAVTRVGTSPSGDATVTADSGAALTGPRGEAEHAPPAFEAPADNIAPNPAPTAADNVSGTGGVSRPTVPVSGSDAVRPGPADPNPIVTESADSGGLPRIDAQPDPVATSAEPTPAPEAAVDATRTAPEAVAPQRPAPVATEVSAPSESTATESTTSQQPPTAAPQPVSTSASPEAGQPQAAATQAEPPQPGADPMGQPNGAAPGGGPSTPPSARPSGTAPNAFTRFQAKSLRQAMAAGFREGFNTGICSIELDLSVDNATGQPVSANGLWVDLVLGIGLAGSRQAIFHTLAYGEGFGYRGQPDGAPAVQRWLSDTVNSWTYFNIYLTLKPAVRNAIYGNLTPTELNPGSGNGH